MNPYLIIGALVAVIASFFAGQHNGARVERAGWLQRENAELVAANAKILQLEEKARAEEAAHAVALNKISADYQGALNDARAETKRLADAARTGGFRLRVHAACPGTAPGAAGAASAAPGGRDGPPAGELPGEAAATLSGADAAFLIDLAGEADEVVRQLGACQAVVRADRAIVQ